MWRVLFLYFLIGAFIACFICPLLCKITGQGKMYNFEDPDDVRMFCLFFFLWPLAIILTVAWIFIETIPEAIAQHTFERNRKKRNKELMKNKDTTEHDNI